MRKDLNFKSNKILLINKLFKNGNKYRFFKFIKIIQYLFRILKSRYRRKLLLIWVSPSLVEDSLLNMVSSKIAVRFRTEKNFISKVKVKTVKTFLLNDKSLKNEFFRLVNLLNYKLPIRTIELRFFYLIFCLYLNTEVFIKISKLSDSYYLNTNSFFEKSGFKN